MQPKIDQKIQNQLQSGIIREVPQQPEGKEYYIHTRLYFMPSHQPFAY